MSAETLTKDNALIFRIVHVDNIARVLSDGCHCRSSTTKAAGYVEIGNPELISKRAGREVPHKPGGTLSDYVPFYFTPYSPMLYNIKTGFNGIIKRPMDDIIILVSSIYHLKEQKLPFVFSDRHAYLKTAQFSDKVEDLDRIIWAELRARNFKRDDLERFEKYQAEALVHKHVPLSALKGLVCYNDSIRAKVKAAADAKDAGVKIIAQPKWYP